MNQPTQDKRCVLRRFWRPSEDFPANDRRVPRLRWTIFTSDWGLAGSQLLILGPCPPRCPMELFSVFRGGVFRLEIGPGH